MTLIISMCTKSGIYLIADRKLTKHSDIYENAGEIQKIIKLNNKVVLSFWGSYELKGNKNVTDLISDFKRKISNGEGIEIISEKLKNFLENQNLLEFDDELGFHLVGYDIDNKPCLKHVFHTEWLQQNKFIDEDSRFSYHLPLSTDKNIHMIGYKEISINNPFPILFNGENSLPNLIINGVKLYQDSIDYEEFDKTEAKDFLKNILDWAIELEKFRKHFKEWRGIIIGYPLDFCSIQPDEIIIEEITK